jgi:transketolase
MRNKQTRQDEVQMDFQRIKAKARQARRYVLKMNHHAGKGHTGADLSEIDIICTLSMAVMDRSRERPDQDRFIPTKGHGAGGLYCSAASFPLIPPA